MSLTDITGIVLGFAFLFAVLGVANALRTKAGLDVFVTRKIVHISVAHWWLIALAFHDSVLPALTGPVVFTVLNYISYRKSLFPALEYRDKTANLGTVYFPVSLIILVGLTFGGVLPVAAGTTGIFVMGYGDGSAALFGKLYGRRTFSIFGNTKSYLGCISMFVVAFAVAMLVGLIDQGRSASVPQLLPASLLIGFAAMFLEVFTPFGIDNITVPVGVTLLAAFLPVTGAAALPLMVPVVIGLALNTAVALTAYQRQSVSGSGGIAGLAVGTVLYVASPGLWGLLMLFFLSSTLIGRFRRQDRTEAESVQAKGSRRDAWQVFANTGAPTIAALLYLVGGGQAAVFAAIAGLAAATSDTWSSEIGVLSRRNPVSILTFRPVPPGVSGGVSLLGLAAGAFGALAVGLAGMPVAQSMGLSQAAAVSVGVTAFGLGTFGTILDSLFGAGLQTRYRRPDGSITERARADDGSHYTRIRGIPGITNDMVNFLTTVCVTAIAVVLAL